MISPLSRREFLELGLLLAPGRAKTASDAAIRLGCVTSEGSLTASILRGVELGLSEADLFAKLFGKRVELLTRSAETAEETMAAGLALLRQERVAAIVGGTNAAAAEALGRAAKTTSGLFLNVGATASRLRWELFDRRTFHVHPGVATLVNAAGLWLIEQGHLTRWALVFAASAFGAEVEAAASALVAGRSAQVLLRETIPVQFEAWATLLQRLRDAQPDVVFLGLEPEDTRSFLRQYRDAGLLFELATVTSDPNFALEAEPASLAGVWPLVWHESLEKYSARDLNGRFSRRFDRPLDGPAWAAWAAVKLLSEAAVRADTTQAQGILEFLEKGLAFDGHKGAALSFREVDHELGQPLYIARARRGTAAGEGGGLEIVAEVSRDRLDGVSKPR